MGAIKTGSTIRISSSGAATFSTIEGTDITGTSYVGSVNSYANQYRINGTVVIDSDRNLVNISSIEATSIDVTGNSDANAFRINGTTVITSGRAATFTTVDATMINAKGLQTGFTTITVSKNGSTGWASATVNCPANTTLVFWALTKMYLMEDGSGQPDSRAKCTATGTGDTLTIDVYEDNDSNVEATCLGLCAYT